MIVAVVVSGPYLIPLIVVYCYLAFKLQRYYMGVFRETIRLKSITNSPIIQAFSEALYGCKTIRASKLEPVLMRQYMHILDENLKNIILSTGCRQWFSLRVNILSFLIIGPSIILAVGFVDNRLQSYQFQKGCSQFFLSTSCL